MKLSGRSVIVTGGARGIGKEIARAFASEGARVAIGDTDLPEAERTAAELGSGALALPLDVTDAAGFAKFFAIVERELGALDVMINNAGIMPAGNFLDEDSGRTEAQIDVNLRGVIHGSRLAGESFRRSGSGHLVNIASLAGRSAYPGVATYSATKFAVVGLTEALRHEFGTFGAHATAILPGVVRTELSAGMQVKSWMRPFVTVDPEDVARAVVRVIGHDVPTRSVPRRMGAALTFMSLVPARPRGALERAVGMHQILVHADPNARAAYERRLEATQRGEVS